jgi:UPF0716 protein FxsA
MWLLALFVAIPLIEIALFIQIGGAIGLFPTLAVVILTAIAGTWLVRSQGAQALMQLRASFEELRDPSEPLAHGAMILFAGALLLTPGFFTDAVGLLLLIPNVRLWLFRYVKSRLSVDSFHYGEHEPRAPSQDDVIEGHWEEVPPGPQNPNQKPSGWTRH